MTERTASELPFPPSTAEKSEVSLRDFGKGRLEHQIGVVEMARVLNTTFADIRGENPQASIVELYRLFADQLPYFISSKSQLETLQAIKSEDPQISKAGTQTFILLYMKSILSAAEPYLTGNPDQDDDLIQAGIANLLTNIPRIALNNSYAHSQYVHVRVLVRTGIVQETANQKNLPVSWVKNNLDAKLDTEPGVAELIDASFIDHPYGLTKEQIRKAAKEISEKTGIPSGSILSVIQTRNFLLSDAEPMNEEDLVDAAFRSILKDAEIAALAGLKKPRDRIVIEALYGLGDQGPLTFEETGALIGLPGNRGSIQSNIGQRKEVVLKRLRADPLLRNLVSPETFPKTQTLPTINSSRVTTVMEEATPIVRLVPSDLVSETRLMYRYPRIGLNYASTPYWMLGILGLSDNVTAALHRINIKNLTQLLTTGESTLAIAGITTEQIEHIKLRIITFLQKDSKVTTIGQRSLDKTGTED